MSRFLSFVRTDVVWVASGQAVALCVGLLNVKIFTNLFSAEQYAYIALMMALSGWIWSGLYQPLNQTIFRFYSVMMEKGSPDGFIRQVGRYQKKLALLTFSIILFFGLYGLLTDKPYFFFLLLMLSACIGVIYGCVHGVVSFFLAQRKRIPVAVIQSTDGLFRLGGGLIAFYWVSRTEYAAATGMVAAAFFFFVLVLIFFAKQLPVKHNNRAKIVQKDKNTFHSYFKKMFFLLLLNASVIHLDKWLLFALIGREGAGKYAVLHMLAMAMASTLYFFYEMLGFPLIFSSTSRRQRKPLLKLLLLAYALSLGGITFCIYKFAFPVLLFFSTDYVAVEHEAFTVLVLACGLLHFGRLLMVEGQIENNPDKYWPSYMILLCFFVAWCLLKVQQDDVLLAAQGFAWGTLAFVIVTNLLNFKSALVGGDENA